MKILKEITKASGKKVMELVDVCCKKDCEGLCASANNPKPTIVEAVKETIEKVVEKVAPKKTTKKTTKKK